MIAYTLPALHKSTWILVADSQSAKIYQHRKTERVVFMNGSRKHPACEEKSEHQLVPVHGMVFESETIQNYQLGHDRRGTVHNSASRAHNAYEPHGDIKAELKRRFVQLIAGKLQQAFAKKAFEHLVLVAPAKMVGMLREQLNPEVREQIIAVLPKDLARYEGKTLMTHLQDTLIEAHVA